ncbi:hypothetical protein DPMN_025164 [Dreissena polymorpha]|uniref:Uncharacterized protein n=1 Tax=Dreissena polymorpha TaxID=45954 RepID=A0A9D4RCB1_DREPO|nr:hypothetical protein DPMN_025164 [Dreissena polymorpha]
MRNSIQHPARLYPAFCVRIKRPGLAAFQKDGVYEELVEPVLCEEADETVHNPLSQAIASVAIEILTRLLPCT